MPRTAHVLRWLAASILASAFAAPAVAAGDGWRNTLTPYLLGVSIEGKATLRDRTTGVDVPTAEVLNALDMAGMLRYRGENETFSINGSTTTGNAAPSSQAPSTRSSIAPPSKRLCTAVRLPAASIAIAAP